MEYTTKTENNNAMQMQLYGKIKYEYCNTMLNFYEKNITQNIIHHLKYKGKEKIGEWLAQLVYNNYKDHEILKNIDAIVYIPIHKIKIRKRGYNQLTLFSRKLSILINKPLIENALIRKINSVTQTSKNKKQRKYNSQIFELIKESELENKHILLIDDIITTGNTLINIYNTIKEIKNIKVSIFTICITNKRT